jgi:hypothetical protein
MRRRGILTVLLVGAPTLALIAASAVAQAPVPRVRAEDDRRLLELVPGAILLPQGVSTSEKELAGLAERTPAEILTWDRAYTMALVRARAGGSAAAGSLDPQALAEQARRHAVADFGRFRKEFLAGRAESGGAFEDPSRAYFAMLSRVQAVEDARGHVATLQNLSRLLQELNRAESAGLSQLSIDLMAEVLLQAGRDASRELIEFRDGLDELKVALGLSTHAAVIPDRRALAAFRDVFNAVEAWSTRPDRRLDELPRIVGRLPASGDAIVEGRPILEPIERDPTRLEDLLEDAVRTAIKNRGGAEKDRAPEDRDAALALRVRRRVRHLVDTRCGYEDAKRSYVLAVRMRDHSFESLLAPPVAAIVPSLTPGLTGLIADQRRIRDAQDRLAHLWTSFRAERLALYRDLGALPYESWDAFYADLSSSPAAGPLSAAPTPSARTPER